MISAFVWLTAHDLRNRWVRRLRRVREPRYALALIAGLAYFWTVLFRPGRPRVSLEGIEPGSGIHLAYAAALALMVASFWLLADRRPPLTFSQAEVQLLFPAPITRRQLVILKLLQAQVVIALGTVLWVALLGGTAGSPWPRAISLWALFATLHLHRVGASLVRASAREHGAAGARHHMGAVVVFGGAALVVAWSVAAALPTLRAAATDGELFDAFGDFLRAPAMLAVLFPFRLILAPLFASSWGEWMRAIIPALLVLLAHVPWVLRTDAAFEEAAADAAAAREREIAAASSRTRRVRAPRAGATRIRLPLAPVGHPATAIAWKNVIALARSISPSTLARLAVLTIAAFAVALSVASDPAGVTRVAGFTLLGLAALLAVMGPQRVRNDLRLDMLRLELLHSFPLSGASIVRAELASSAGVLAALQMVIVPIASALLPLGEWAGDVPSARAALTVAAMIALPTVTALGVLVQNAGALLFPAWVRLGLARPGGVEAIGQTIITTIGSLAVLSLMLAAPVLLGGALAVLAMARAGVWGLLPGVVLGAAIVLAELWWITAWLGRVLERTEPLEGDGS